MSARATVVAIASLLLTAGCAGLSGNAAAPVSEPATVVVTNHNWSDMTVYLVHEGAQIRIGSVGSMRTERFRLPSIVRTGQNWLMARALGGRTSVSSNPLLIAPGAEFEWQIENAVGLSVLRMR